MCKEYMAIQDPARKESLIRRLAEKTKLNEQTGCIEWTAKAVNNGGYGNISAGRAFVGMRSHRLAWVLFTNEEIPSHLVVMHSCDNPKCCNVKHLSLGTRKDNMDDKMAKGRGVPPPRLAGDNHPFRRNPELRRRGDTNGNSKLSEGQAVEILRSSESLSVLSERYGVSKSTISSIKNRTTWRHLEP